MGFFTNSFYGYHNPEMNSQDGHYWWSVNYKQFGLFGTTKIHNWLVG